MKAKDVVTLLRRAQMALMLFGADEEKELIKDIDITASFMEKQVTWTQERPMFEQCVRLMIHLHKEIDQGRGDEAVADDIRDQLDLPCRSLAPWQTALINDLSAALYDDPNTNETLRARYERKEEALKIYNDMPIG